MPRRPNNPESSPAARFGFELRRFRQEARMTQADLGREVGYTGAAIGALERGLRLPKDKHLVEQCDAALTANGDLLQIWEECRSDGNQRWFFPWLDVEQQARTLRTWQPNLIPGLLQTADYARVVIERPGMSAAEIEKAVKARLDRQSIFARDRPPMMWAVLDEVVLQRPVGGADVMKDQLKQLLTMAEHPCITVQIVPLSAACTAGLLGGFVLAQMRDGREVVYLDSAGKGQVTAQTKEVRDIQLLYEAIKANALPQNESLLKIKEWMNRWTS
ncbi:transcriptional regulator [Sphaerisporangium rufum]|uniref:Transcriptional regulator n=1 Tax=Sphaerisporangium rufum TaxID=1381558 RepID=A0A919RBH2_9ACTN|nr:helix-turn-helix transcriptional regulator [Sphaerisporangium rufum]GII80900.1 transcriptional regulator [Sphaerisporangium rufum]